MIILTRRLAAAVVGLGLASAAASAQVSSLDYLLTGEMNIPESGLAPIDPPRTFEASGSFLPSDTFDVPTRFEGVGVVPRGSSSVV